MPTHTPKDIYSKKSRTERFECATRWPLTDPFAVKKEVALVRYFQPANESRIPSRKHVSRASRRGRCTCEKKKSAKHARRTQDSVKRLVVDIARFRRPSFSLSFLARVPAKKKCAPKLLDGARDANIGAGDSTFFASREWVFAPFSEIHDRLPRVVFWKE